ncbi:MAG: DUF3445 domain-containing protein [Verrucomicrobiales bacterium]|nr:DUF3445 domain-containing protein [Verrucomicrobiales bacterium]
MAESLSSSSGPRSDPHGTARLPLEEIFAPTDYQHRLRLARGEVRAFFGHWHDDPSLLAERRRWLTCHPDRHAVALPESLPVLRETAQWFHELELGDLPDPGAEAASLCAAIGGMVEPDLLWLVKPAAAAASPTSPPPARMIAGAVAGPSSWAPEEKLGHDLQFIHGVVPELNRELAHAIDGFMARLRPGVAWLRANWGLSASPEYNQHPSRAVPRLQPPLSVESTWVRIEHQALTLLPESGAILFGIRIENRRLSEMMRDARVGAGLAQALRTMPEPMARYKGIAPVRQNLLELLRAH